VQENAQPPINGKMIKIKRNKFCSIKVSNQDGLITGDASTSFITLISVFVQKESLSMG